ncbi:phosphate signaling complex protein PhoU [Gulosibacter sediminis]|uniref:phosphate signaling complex protein PhoU n=1 Tax=Gulosibacter sediminis TaxID=1729695 RepID=UPI0024AD355D|nr:phosphate signaling complex protein PhoU [Gulosibacter sediminis]
MREIFQQELAQVQGGLVNIANHVQSAMTRALASFAHSDVAVADEVIGDDLKIDEQTAQLDDLTLEILLMQAPVANDLRFIVSTMRMSGSLERMGDLAAHIAQLARMRYPEESGASQVRQHLLEMGALDVAQAERLVRLFESEEPHLIDEIVAADDEIDAKHKQVLDTLGELEQDGNQEASPTQVVDATLANRYLERFSDHAVSIAKRIRYQQEGTEQEA